MANFLEMLGLQSPGVGSFGDASYGDPNVPAFASDPQNMAPTSSPQNLLASVPGYGPESAPDFSQSQPDAPITTLPDVSNYLQNLGGSDAPSVAAPARTPRERHSFLDTVGRISDVLAKVGGADALYQPTLDAREDRRLSLEDRARAVDLEKVKIASAQGELGDQNNARLGQAVRGLQAIISANPQADISKIWPLISKQAGVDPERAAVIGQAIAQNPDLLTGLASAAGVSKEFGLQPFYATDPQGNLSAYQFAKDGSVQKVALPDGVTPIDPTKPINLGGTTAMVGSRSGNVRRVLPNTEKPGAVADRQAKIDIAAGNNQATVTAAGIRAAGSGGKSGAKGGKGVDVGSANAALAALDNIKGDFDYLHSIKALPGDNGGTVNNIAGAIERSVPGVNALSGQFGGDAAQRRALVTKSLNDLQQQILKALPASATRTVYEQRILKEALPDPFKMSYNTANAAIARLRASWAATLKDAQDAAAKETSSPAATPSRGPTRVQPRAGARAPAARSSGGWSIVGVK